MYTISPHLSRLMRYYNTDSLSHGAKEDKLGDVYEDYCVALLSDKELLKKAQQNNLNSSNTDEYIFMSVLSKQIFPHIQEINRISATREIQPRITGGNPKTDIIIDIETDLKTLHVPVSIKQTTARKVAMAEFDVETIVREIGITDQILISYLEKHQRDASAKNFSADEKHDLTIRLHPYVRSLVRWVVTGTPQKTDDLRYPDLLLKFSLTKSDDISDIKCYDVDKYVDLLIYDTYGNPKKGGFGTGLSWTYATGSKFKKIQFKG